MADLWDDEDLYWRGNYSTRPYAAGHDYETLRPGYRYGYESASRYASRSWTGRRRHDINVYAGELEVRPPPAGA